MKTIDVDVFLASLDKNADYWKRASEREKDITNQLMYISTMAAIKAVRHSVQESIKEQQ